MTFCLRAVDFSPSTLPSPAYHCRSNNSSLFRPPSLLVPSVSSRPPVFVVFQGTWPCQCFDNVTVQMKIIGNSETLLTANGTAAPQGDWWKNILLLSGLNIDRRYYFGVFFPGIGLLCLMYCKFKMRYSCWKTGPLLRWIDWLHEYITVSGEYLWRYSHY